MAVAKKSKTLQKKNPVVSLHVDFLRDSDGSWVADVPAIPGVMAYGTTKATALRNVQALALRVIADMLQEGEIKRLEAPISFEVA
jgi:predicted RNase H-like HicB family nuclease